MTPPMTDQQDAGLQPLQRYPALASWIERLANIGTGLSLSDWMVFVDALNNALVQAERRPSPPLPGEHDAGEGR